MKIFTKLAHEENKCIIIVIHSKNVTDNVDVVYKLKKIKVYKYKESVLNIKQIFCL